MSCTTIGSIELAALYGRCRRYDPKRPTTATANPAEVCPTCLYFVAGNDIDPDMCLAEPSDTDTTANADGVINHCKLHQPIKPTRR